MTTAASSEQVAVPTVFDEKSTELARTYANAILGAAEAHGGSAEPVIDELEELLADVWVGQPKFAALLSSGSVASLEKDRILLQTFEGRAVPIVLNFLRVLNRHDRLSLLPAIVRQVRASWDRKQNRLPVTVRSAVPLDETAQAALTARLTTMIHATPILRLEVDPSLIGGLVIQVGDDVYDASVRTRLARLRDRLIESQTHEIQSRRDYFSHSA